MTDKAREYTGYSQESFNRTIPEMNEPLDQQQPLMAALRSEHRQMARIMELFRDQLKSIESGELVDTHVVYELMYYMVTIPDRFHHPREDVIYQRVAELDGDYEQGQVYLYLGVLETLFPPVMGGRPEEGRAHFEAAIARSEGRNLMAKVMYAEQYARLVFDQELHDRLLSFT